MADFTSNKVLSGVIQKSYVGTPTINGVPLAGDLSLSNLSLQPIYRNTKEKWDSTPDFIGEDGAIYIYTNLEPDSSKSGIKIGDGMTPLKDLPFIGQKQSEGSDETYTYQQTSISNQWTIEHNLNRYPSVTVVDSAGSTVVGDVHYVDSNKIIITFAGEFIGTAYLN